LIHVHSDPSSYSSCPPDIVQPNTQESAGIFPDMETRRETCPYHFARRTAKTSAYAQFMYQIQEQQNCK